MRIAFPSNVSAALVAALVAFAQLTSVAAVPAIAVAPVAGGEPWNAAAVARLDTELDAMLTTDPALHGAHFGVFAVDTASGGVLYAHNDGDAFQPASTLKLLVGSAALERLGPDYRFRTQLETLHGDLVLRAGGDPFLNRVDFDDAARAVAAARIATFGGLFVDDSHDDRIPYAPGWTWDDFAYDYAAHVSAMTLDENVVHLVVAPGVAVGELATIRSEPLDAAAMYAQRCEAMRAGRIAITPLARTSAAGTSSTLDVRVGNGGCLEVFGTIPLGGAPESLDAAVDVPLASARMALARALHARNIVAGPSQPSPDEQVEDMVRRVGPGERIIWTHDSAPLSTWLGPRFWIPSDNLVGELLLKELGFATAGAPGSTEKGVAFETAWLQSIGIDPATVTLADGSGLSQYDRITPRDLVAVLQHDWNGPQRALVLASLPIGGTRGTIEGIAGSTAAGRVFAKTGSMMHVRALAGYLATERHGAVTFAFMVDDWLGEYTALASLRARVLSRIVTD